MSVLKPAKKQNSKRDSLSYSKQSGLSEAGEVVKDARQVFSEINELLSSAADEGRTLIGHHKKQFEQAFKRVEMSKDKLDIALIAIKGGGVKDKDLDLAVKEANKAIAHAKRFLLK